jgi:hypothetical protein
MLFLVHHVRSQLKVADLLTQQNIDQRWYLVASVNPCNSLTGRYYLLIVALLLVKALKENIERRHASRNRS